MRSIVSRTELSRTLIVGSLSLFLLLVLLLLGFQPPLQAATSSRPLSLSEAHRAVWKIHNIQPGEIFGERNHHGRGTVFAIGPKLFVTNHHVFRHFVNNSPLAEITLSQKGSSSTLKIKRILVLSQAYDLVLFETTTPTEGYLELAYHISLEQLTGLSLIGYPKGSLLKMKQKAKSLYDGDWSYALSIDNESDLHGGSGGPIINAQGKVVGVLTIALPDTNMILGVKLEHLENLMFNNFYKQEGFTVCTQYSLDRCFEEGYKKLSDMARKGSAIAQYQLAKLYGHDDPSDPSALYWLEESANNDFAPSLARFSLFLNKRGRKEDLALAYQLMEQAAQQNYASAQYNVAVMLLWGLGTKRDENKATDWLRKALEQGLDKAETLL